jgi:hypothetical protein
VNRPGAQLTSDEATTLLAMACAGCISTGLLFEMNEEQVRLVRKLMTSATAHTRDNPGHAKNDAATAALVRGMEKLAQHAHGLSTVAP